MGTGLLRCAAVVMLLSIAACQPLSPPMNQYEKVSHVSIAPANPSPGETVTVQANSDSSWLYSGEPGFGPKVHYRVSAGELLVTLRPERGEVRISDREAILERVKVDWRLPLDKDRVTVWASMTDGEKSLDVKFD